MLPTMAAKDPTKPRKPRARKAAAEAPPPTPAPPRLRRRILRWTARAFLGLAGLALALILLYSLVNPPTNLYQVSESARLGGIQQDWVGWDDIAPVMARSVVAAEDANFCLHWGFDMAAIRAAMDDGANRGASTLTQQVVKNVFLWQSRSWVRKAIEAAMTPAVELVWSKRRILEVYMNVAEFGEGIFGVQAAAQHFFGIDAADLSATQAARLAAVLPDPKGRSPVKPGPFTRKRTAQIIQGAETILQDGRAACFEGQGPSRS